MDIKVGDKVIPSELAMKMEQIRTYLERGRAAVMVGAGFSKNAQASTISSMKDWGELTELMYTQLFVSDADKHKNLLSEPLKLALMYEACFGRSALDSLIQNALPDSTTYPGELHMKLMRLPWKDVFTTNYDTLLERAALDSDIPYAVVTNRETLLYSDSPRILKLHGSFPNIRPYIITEEDFRTYPQKNPAFVNTVRQALMENLFCLIGFSGEDPNFLQWIGWMRDVMQGEQMPIYLVTYDSYMHESQKVLMRERGVDVINLSDIIGANYSEGLRCFLEFIGQPKSKLWSEDFSLTGLTTKESVLSVTQKLRKMREVYPNWLFLPPTSYKDFDRLNENCWQIKDDVLKKLSPQEYLLFLYEIVWCYQISLTLIRVKWVWEAMCALKLDDIENKGLESQVIEIKLYLLRMCRFFSEKTLWKEIVRELEEQSELLSSRQRSMLYYEQCLENLTLLEYEKVRTILTQWHVQLSDAQCVLWKSSVMLEIGQKSDALNLLNITSQRMKQSILSSGTKENVASTYLEAISELMYIAEPFNNVRPKNTMLAQLKHNIIDSLLTAKDKPSEFNETTHSFGIGRVMNTWHSMINSTECLHYTFRYLMLQEVVGCPMGLPHRPINEKWISLCIEVLSKCLPQFSVELLIRIANGNLVKQYWNREIIGDVQERLADNIYECYQDKLQLYLSKYSDKPFAERVQFVLVPILSRIATRTNIYHTEDMCKKMLAIYDAKLMAFDDDCYHIVQDSLFASDKARANYSGLLLPILGDIRMSFTITSTMLEFTPIHDKIIDVIEVALNDKERRKQQEALSRVWKIMLADINAAQKERLCGIVRKWRNGSIPKRMREQQYFSYEKVPYDSRIDINSPETLVTKIINDISKLDISSLRNSVMSDLCETIGLLSYMTKYVTAEQQGIVLTQVCSFLTKNEGTLCKDDSTDLLGGFRSECNRMVSLLMLYVSRSDFADVSVSVLHKLQEIAIRYNGYEVPMVAVIVRLNMFTKSMEDDDVQQLIEKALVHASESICYNSLQAVKMLGAKESCRAAVITTMLEYAMYSQADRVADYLRTFVDMLVSGTLRRDRYEKRINDMLWHMAQNVDIFIKVESKIDIAYWANYLAGVVAAKWGENQGTIAWKDITKSTKYFNDVRAAYDLGQVAIGGRQRWDSLVLKEQ